MSPRLRRLELTNNTNILFFYHNGFSTDSFSIQIRIRTDLTTEVLINQNEGETDIMLVKLPSEIKDVITVLLGRKSTEYSRKVFDSYIEDLGGGSLQCRFGDSQILKFQIEEPVTEETLPPLEVELLSLYKALRDFGLAIK